MRSDLLGYNAPIVRKQGNYYYDDKSFSIRNATITDQDIANLSATIKMFKAYRGLEFFHEIESLVNKLEKKVHLKTYQQVEQWISNLIKAITEKQVIRLTHKKFSRSQERTYTVHPYFLKEYRNRWYVLGWYPDENYIKTFALDRVINIEPLPHEDYLDTYKPDPETYFKNTIGISLPNTEPVQVQLRFTGDIPAYIKSQPIHTSQELVDESPDALVINLDLVVNHELESLILSYAENVQVILPSHLAERIQKRLKEASDSYSATTSKASTGTSKNEVSS
jgi:predicted DNA-binding transcriptional regulator YafY